MPFEIRIPRLVVAGTASGVGKTTFTVGLVYALRSRGLKVAVFKCGPDYLDPTYHSRAAGVRSHNLDGWMMGREAVTATFVRAAAESDIAIIEGVMGLFDGASATDESGSTAEIAKWLDAPVLLLVDASGMARSVAAVGRGFAEFDPELQVSALIANRVGSKGHLELLREASARPPVIGGLPNEASAAFPERHLGLRTAEELAGVDALFSRWGALVNEWCEVDKIISIAAKAPPLPGAIPMTATARRTSRCTIGIAYDEAFHFYYEDNLARLESAGARLIRFSPIHDTRLPEVDGLYLGGGYPETYAAELQRNVAMREQIAEFAARGGIVYAECGGLMYLCRELQTLDARTYRMCDVVPARTIMCERLQALGYVEGRTLHNSIFGPGLGFRGHKFRYSRIESLSSKVAPAFAIRRTRNGAELEEGFSLNNVIASYVHVHWASNPNLAEAMAGACVRARATTNK